MNEFEADLEPPSENEAAEPEPPRHTSNRAMRRAAARQQVKKIEAMRHEPLRSTGKPPSPESVKEAKRIARLSQQRAGDDGLPVSDPAVTHMTAPEEELPPDPTGFVITRDKFGPGVHGVYLADGRPLGVWLHSEHPSLSGQQVESLLLEMGLEPELARTYGKRRGGDTELPPDIARVWGQGQDAETARILIDEWGLETFRSSQLHTTALKERGRDAKMKPIREAYIKAMHEKREKKR